MYVHICMYTYVCTMHRTTMHTVQHEMHTYTTYEIKYTCVYVIMCAHVCHVYMYVCTPLPLGNYYVIMCVHVHVCIHTHEYTRTHIHKHTCTCVHVEGTHVHM